MPNEEQNIPDYSPEDLEKLARANLAQVQDLARQAAGVENPGLILGISGALSQAVTALASTRCHSVLNSAVSLANQLKDA